MTVRGGVSVNSVTRVRQHTAAKWSHIYKHDGHKQLLGDGKDWELSWEVESSGESDAWECVRVDQD